MTSSAKDQLTGMNVAIKKIMKPFSAPVLAKRTYRELKLLKALMHENVRSFFLLEKKVKLKKYDRLSV
jgi:p38 MAP kinase